jgi:death-on-curing protein
MRYLTLGEVVELHRLVLATSGGATGIRDLGALESAVAQTRASFGGRDLHPTLIEKTGALGFALAQGHPFMLNLASGRLSRSALVDWLREHVTGSSGQAV